MTWELARNASFWSLPHTCRGRNSGSGAQPSAFPQGLQATLMDPPVGKRWLTRSLSFSGPYSAPSFPITEPSRPLLRETVGFRLSHTWCGCLRDTVSRGREPGLRTPAPPVLGQCPVPNVHPVNPASGARLAVPQDKLRFPTGPCTLARANSLSRPLLALLLPRSVPLPLLPLQCYL